MDEATTEEHLDRTATPEAVVDASGDESAAPPAPEADLEVPPGSAGEVNAEAKRADEEDMSQAQATGSPMDVTPTERGGRRALRILAAVLGVGLLLAVAGVAYATYDFKKENEGKLLPGTTVGGVDVGGMTRSEAVRAVTKSLRPTLDRTIAVRFGEREWDVTPRELGARGTVRSAVRSALEASESASWVDLASARFLDGELDVDRSVAVRYPKRGVRAYVAALTDEVNVEARDAEIDYSSGWVEIRKERVGYELKEKASTDALLAAVRGDRSGAELEVRELKPEVTSDAFDQVLLVRQSDFKLYLYTDGKITNEWPIAVGMAEFPTPSGEFSVELKRVMPTWVNPAPDGWGSDMPAMIPPGPENPLGVRAINWTAPGIRFHGTAALSSIGTRASHGCVRLSNEDVLELFDLVEVGSPIISVPF